MLARLVEHVLEHVGEVFGIADRVVHPLSLEDGLDERHRHLRRLHLRQPPRLVLHLPEWFVRHAHRGGCVDGTVLGATTWIQLRRTSDEAAASALRRSSELLVTELDRFETLLGDLLEISRFDAGAAVLDLYDTDLTALPWVDHRSRRWEPEPLRWTGVTYVQRSHMALQEKIRGQHLTGPGAPRHLRSDDRCEYSVPEFMDPGVEGLNTAQFETCFEERPYEQLR